ncbi:hypothetical protein [Clostridium pasteurianum]|uniref:Helix-turn-helix domain-containing protein n=1 Tax=Clostridium pasteurianum BC1 TaxID=86416 RepID=R4K270_CLOPA|nr:hypothetical protein [Clostridium pasteurianum]AGK96668.1 hypothetical protein Clopa_1751 [Clostridium pasteurianum BC1]
MNKDKYFEEVRELVKMNKNINKEDFELLFLVVSGVDVEVNADFLTDKIVKSLSIPYSTEILISWGFLQTEVGRALIKAKFNLSNEIYFISDLVELTGFTKSMISKEIAAGNINYEKRGGKIFFRANDVKEYLAKKGIDKVEKENTLKYETIKEKLIGGDFERETDYK